MGSLESDLRGLTVAEGSSLDLKRTSLDALHGDIEVINALERAFGRYLRAPPALRARHSGVMPSLDRHFAALLVAIAWCAASAAAAAAAAAAEGDANANATDGAGGAPRLRIAFDLSNARPGVVAPDELRAVGDALGQLLAVRDATSIARRGDVGGSPRFVVGEPKAAGSRRGAGADAGDDLEAGEDEARYAGGPVQFYCDPYSDAPVVVDLGSMLPGEMLVFVHTYNSSEVDSCAPESGTMAHAQICAHLTWTEFSPTAGPSSASTRYVVRTLVAYVNVCQDGGGSVSSPGSTASLRHALYAHELLHAIGFIQDIMELADVLRDVEGAPGLKAVPSPGVVEWSRFFYGCESMRGGYIVNGHWDPFFVGWPELMSQRISADHRITLATLALLSDLGAYDVIPEEGVAGLIELGLWRPADALRTRASDVGCSVAAVQCGLGSSFASASECASRGVGVGQWVVAPHLPGETPLAAAPRTTPAPAPIAVIPEEHAPGAWRWSGASHRHRAVRYVGYPEEAWALGGFLGAIAVFWLLMLCFE